MKSFKKLAVLMVMVLAFAASSQAQYKVNKQKYNYKEYQYQAGDRYSPAVAGVCSFFVPGLGQMVSGEVGRGFGFLGGYVGSYVLMNVGAANVIETGEGAGIMYLGLAGALTTGIWSIVDAVRVAKVNNMAGRNTSSIKFAPTIGTTFDNKHMTTGLSLNITM